MEICMNKKSKMNFIYIENVDEDHFMAITPSCKARVLEVELFSDLLVGNTKDFITSGLLSESQAHAYDQYVSYRKHDREELATRFLESMTESERQALIAYCKKKLEQGKMPF